MPGTMSLPDHPRTTSRLLALIPMLLLGTGCKETTVAPVAARLTIVQGQLQQAAVGAQLPTPIVLRVSGTDGLPMAKVPVSFSVTQGGGAIDPASAMSDANGEVKAKWTLGPTAQVQQVAATVPGLEAVLLNALAIVPSDLVVAQGNNQAAKAGAALPVQIVLRVTGGNNVPIPNQTVALSVVSGGGSLSPQSATTNALGEVTVRWTLGPAVGTQLATASSGPVGPISITATAN